MFISRTLRNRAYIGILDYNRYQGRGSSGTDRDSWILPAHHWSETI